MARTKHTARKSIGGTTNPPKRKNPFFIEKSEKKQNLEKITQLILFDDLIIEILQFLNSCELKNFSLTSKLHYETIHHEESFCKVLYQGIPPQVLKQFQFQGGLELIRKSPYLEHFQESYDHDDEEYFNHDLEFNIDSDGIYSFQLFEPISHNVTNFVDLFYITKILSSIGNDLYVNDSENALKYLGDIEIELSPFIIDTKTIHKEVQVEIHDIRWFSIERLKEIKMIDPIRTLEKLFYPQKCIIHSWDEFWKIQKENQENVGILKMKKEMERICQNLCYVNINTSSSSCTSEFNFFLGEFGQYLVGFYFFVKETLYNPCMDKGYIYGDDGEKISWNSRKKRKSKQNGIIHQ
jgi:hypothetical protein